MLALVLSLFALAAPVLTAAPSDDVPALAEKALAGDADAVATLRALGQPGLDRLVALRRSLSSVPPLFVGPATPLQKQWEALVDAVARQRYASASGLYWYTDLTAAKAIAKAQNKPILSLRLLGDLDQDFSCANSRFFRTILYPDPAIAAALHDRFVLHWQSVHEVPRIEIDFGGGRKLVRTITGNSLHYVMTADGDIVEVMPGMVGPAAFAAWLDDARKVAADIAATVPTMRPIRITAHFREVHERGLATWQAALAKLGLDVGRDAGALARATTDEVLGRLAADVRIVISPEANALVGPMVPTERTGRWARRAMPLAITKAAVEAPILRQLDRVEGKLAEDQVHNLLDLRTRIASLAAQLPLRIPELVIRADALATEPLTQDIYAEVFLTPLDDPWMGLADADVFTGLPPELERPESASR